MSLTPNPHRKLGFSLPPSPAPFLTPRPEKRPSDLRWADGSSTLSRLVDKDREVNIQVVLRCRPLNDEEQRTNVQRVISCNEQRKEVIVLQGTTNRPAEKTFAFDKVFGPKAQQRSIYEHAVAPFVNDVLYGHSCTIFAYGQTGTGKTYTMEGGLKSKGGELSVNAGVIPRAVRHIFDVLEAQKADYSMKVTFLELYNEEITDLLAPEDQIRYLEDRPRRPISLMEDGKGGAVIRGLQEEVVYSAKDIYNLLDHVSAKRRSAATLLNKQSSRSHSIFSITIHVKEASLGNEELIKCGRLNLVDLAGSENISRSGAKEARAREAGEMNKSLLTLGRVISALVDHSGHIPYRDSKLTRLLRESLGGKAKTCIIATVSPSIHCLEETLNTLDYAYRAKSIKNKPEVNQKLFKSVLLKDLYLEIERMKQDVRAAREKNGVYVPHERFAQDEAEKKVTREKIGQLELDLENKKKESDRFEEFYHVEQERNMVLESEIRECKTSLESSRKDLSDLQEVHRVTTSMLKEKEFIIAKLLQSEHALVERAKELHSNLENASEDRVVLLMEIERKAKIEKGNQGLIMHFSSELDQSLKTLHDIVLGSVCQNHQLLNSMEEHASSFFAAKCEEMNSLDLRIAKIKDIYASGVEGMKKLAVALQKKNCIDLDQLKATVFSQTMAVENFLVTAVSEAEQLLEDLQRSLRDQKQLLTFSVEQQEAGLQRSLIATQVISRSTIDFFNDLHERACRCVRVLEDSEIERSNQLAAFQNTYKELSAKEEKAALEKIATILTNLTATKDNMALEALCSMNTTSLEVKDRLRQEISDLQQASTNAEKRWIAYEEKVESKFQEDTIATAVTRDMMESILQSCSDKVGRSIQYWESAQLSIDKLNKGHVAEIESTVEDKSHETKKILGEVMSLSSSTDVEIGTATCDLLINTKSTLLLDHEARKEIESISAMCFERLKLLQNDHSESTRDIRNLIERCLVREYLVDHSTSITPKKSTVNVPSLSSIEELRTPSLVELAKEMGTKAPKEEMEGKPHHNLQMQAPRSPLMTIN